MNPVRAYRISRSLSQGDLGQMVGVEKAAVSKWEAGTPPSPESAIKLEEVSKGEISKSALRPDLWPAPTPEPAR